MKYEKYLVNVISVIFVILTLWERRSKSVKVFGWVFRRRLSCASAFVGSCVKLLTEVKSFLTTACCKLRPKVIVSLLSELWLVVPGCHYLRDAVWVPSVLLQTPQSDNSQGHAEKDHDREFWISRGRVEPDLRDGERHRAEVSWLRQMWYCSLFVLRNWKITWKCIVTKGSLFQRRGKLSAEHTAEKVSMFNAKEVW